MAETLQGKTVDLKSVGREDLPLLVLWSSDPDFAGEFEPFEPTTLPELEKWYDELEPEEKWFIIEKKDGSKIGQIYHCPAGPHFQIGLRLLPGERGKGFGTEAVMIVVDHLFITRDVVRVQAECSPKNTSSMRVLEKAGFKQEGLRRKSVFIRGQWKDGALLGILKEDWKAPKVLSKTTV